MQTVLAGKWRLPRITKEFRATLFLDINLNPLGEEESSSLIGEKWRIFKAGERPQVSVLSLRVQITPGWRVKVNPDSAVY